MFLTREIAKNCNSFKKVKVDTSDWTPGEESYIYVRELSARERDEFEASLSVGTGKKFRLNFDNVRARLAVIACCDDSGNPVFQPEDVVWLTERPAGVLSKIYNIVQELNNFSEDDIEDLVKNSKRTA